MSPVRPESHGTCRAHLTPRGSRAGGDDGSASLFVVVAVVALMLAIGLVVDGGHKLVALQRADDLAQEAARSASQQIVAAPSVRGQAPRLDVAAAERAVQQYLAIAATTGDGGGQEVVTGSSSATATHVEVSVTVSEPTTFLGAIGVNTVTATSHATARLVRGLDQEVP